MKCIILLWIFPCRKWRKWAEIAILSIWRKLQNRPRILKMLQNSPAKITESDPKLSDFADQSLSRTDMSSFGFLWFLALWSTNLDPNSTPNIRPKSPIILGGKLGLETQVLGVGCSPKTLVLSSSPSLPPSHSHVPHIFFSPSTFLPPSMSQ